jgi:hypothetical protein
MPPSDPCQLEKGIQMEAKITYVLSPREHDIIRDSLARYGERTREISLDQTAVSNVRQEASFLFSEIQDLLTKLR